MNNRTQARFSSRHKADLDRRVEQSFENAAEARYDALLNVLQDFAAMAFDWPVEARSPGDRMGGTGDDLEEVGAADRDLTRSRTGATGPDGICPHCGRELAISL